MNKHSLYIADDFGKIAQRSCRNFFW